MPGLFLVVVVFVILVVVILLVGVFLRRIVVPIVVVIRLFVDVVETERTHYDAGFSGAAAAGFGGGYVVQK